MIDNSGSSPSQENQNDTPGDYNRQNSGRSRREQKKRENLWQWTRWFLIGSGVLLLLIGVVLVGQSLLSSSGTGTPDNNTTVISFADYRDRAEKHQQAATDYFNEARLSDNSDVQIENYRNAAYRYQEALEILHSFQDRVEEADVEGDASIYDQQIYKEITSQLERCRQNLRNLGADMPENFEPEQTPGSEDDTESDDGSSSPDSSPSSNGESENDLTGNGSGFVEKGIGESLENQEAQKRLDELENVLIEAERHLYNLENTENESDKMEHFQKFQKDYQKLDEMWQSLGENFENAHSQLRNTGRRIISLVQSYRTYKGKFGEGDGDSPESGG